MKGLARVLTEGRLQAMIALALLSLLSVLLPPAAGIISGTPLALIALRQGLNIALQNIFGTFVLVSCLFLLSGFAPQSMLVFLMIVWLPILLAAIVLRQSESQGAMLSIVGLLAMVFVVYLHQQTHSVAADYREVFEAFWQSNILPNIAPNTSPETIEDMKRVMDNFVPFMSGLRACMVVIGIVSSVLLARWWQSRVYNRGGFKKEFLMLQLPKWLLVPLAICAGIVFMNGLIDDSISRDCLMVFMCLYLFQGIACVHTYVERRANQQAWLVGMYLSLVFIPLYAAIILACIGVADSVMGRNFPHEPAT